MTPFAGRLYAGAAEIARRSGALGLVPHALELLTVSSRRWTISPRRSAAADGGPRSRTRDGHGDKRRPPAGALGADRRQAGTRAGVPRAAAEALRESVPRNLILPIVTAKWALGYSNWARASPGGVERAGRAGQAGAEYHEIASHFSAPDRVEAAVRSGHADIAVDALKSSRPGPPRWRRNGPWRSRPAATPCSPPAARRRRVRGGADPSRRRAPV